MIFALGPVAASSGCGLAAFDQLGSTNAEALRMAASEQAAAATWVVAARQTGGHGRRGRAWSSPDGNLAATYLAAIDVPSVDIASLGFVAGVALFDAVASLAPSARRRIALKWPNDLLADGAKLAGVLVEVAPGVNGGHAVAVGFGVNVLAPPEGLSAPATALRTLGCPADAADLFSALTDSWHRVLLLWDRGRGMTAIRTCWLDRASGLGQPIEVRTSTDHLKGTFSMIDDRGRLVIETSGGPRTVTAGEVFFGTAATVRAS